MCFVCWTSVEWQWLVTERTPRNMDLLGGVFFLNGFWMWTVTGSCSKFSVQPVGSCFFSLLVHGGAEWMMHKGCRKTPPSFRVYPAHPFQKDVVTKLLSKFFGIHDLISGHSSSNKNHPTLKRLFSSGRRREFEFLPTVSVTLFAWSIFPKEMVDVRGPGFPKAETAREVSNWSFTPSQTHVIFCWLKLI